MDPNQSAVWIALITSVTTIILAVIGLWRQRSLEKKVDVGNAVTTATHTIANGRTDSLLKQLEEKNAEIARLSRLLPPAAVPRE